MTRFTGLVPVEEDPEPMEMPIPRWRPKLRKSTIKLPRLKMLRTYSATCGVRRESRSHLETFTKLRPMTPTAMHLSRTTRDKSKIFGRAIKRLRAMFEKACIRANLRKSLKQASLRGKIRPLEDPETL